MTLAPDLDNAKCSPSVLCRHSYVTESDDVAVDRESRDLQRIACLNSADIIVTHSPDSVRFMHRDGGWIEHDGEASRKWRSCYSGRTLPSRPRSTLGTAGCSWGKEGRSIPADKTWDHVWGYTILNDVTLRGLHSQLGPTPKVFDTSAPVGPWIVPKDQVADPQNVGLKFRISGRQVQDGSTSSMRFQILDMLSEISKWHTLRPGDIIATGDVSSVEPVKPGDIMEAEVEGIGVLRNPVKLED